MGAPAFSLCEYETTSIFTTELVPIKVALIYSSSQGLQNVVKCRILKVCSKEFDFQTFMLKIYYMNSPNSFRTWISFTSSVNLLWVHSHSGIPDNEKFDLLAKPSLGFEPPVFRKCSKRLEVFLWKVRLDRKDQRILRQIHWLFYCLIQLSPTRSS